MSTAPTLPFHPQGYLSVATNLGIKDATLDFTVIYSTARAAALRADADRRDAASRTPARLRAWSLPN